MVDIIWPMSYGPYDMAFWMKDNFIIRLSLKNRGDHELFMMKNVASVNDPFLFKVKLIAKSRSKVYSLF